MNVSYYYTQTSNKLQSDEVMKLRIAKRANKPQHFKSLSETSKVRQELPIIQ